MEKRLCGLKVTLTDAVFHLSCLSGLAAPICLVSGMPSRMSAHAY